ncbi:sciellin [Hemicordylus capensis]|uniref:sciellin n=1 Tax=Hemicordylus capensis TaxID=884348 RepID=UPI002304752D|nr:sciellin [Hemicordylus capensis]
MATFSVGKSSHNKEDTKNASIAMKSRQQVINEVNKRRTLLQDNSWIKKRAEEENTDENYGKVVLNQYKSQDSLHRDPDEKDDQKALLSRYRSDSTLDRISGKSDADKANKLPTLDGRHSNNKESGISGNADTATSPVKKKRQSWMPPPVSSQKPRVDDTEQKRHSWTPSNTAAAVAINNKNTSSTSDKPGGPKMTIYSSEAITSPNDVVNDQPRTRQVCPAKPSESNADRSSTTEKIGRNQDLDNLIKVKAKGDPRGKRHQELDDLIKVNRTSNGHDKGGKDLDDLIAVNNTTQKNRRSQELDDLIVIKSSTVDQNIKGASEQGNATANIPGSISDTDNLYQVTRGSSYNASSSCAIPKDTIVYTRTYETSRFPHDAYEDNMPGKSIKTVYSTSDRAIIEKEMCTYCRKPLGTDTKMILDTLQICCHAACFKCEVCEGPLENLKAGDSIWIYKNTVHCSPCYSKAKASWAY